MNRETLELAEGGPSSPPGASVPATPPPTYHRPSYRPSYRPPLSERIDDWFDSDTADTISGIMAYGIPGMFVLSVLISQGFWWALLVGVICLAAHNIFLITVGVLRWAARYSIVLPVRFVEWFIDLRLLRKIAVIAVAAVIILWFNFFGILRITGGSSGKTEPARTEKTSEDAHIYFCTADNVNVRARPSLQNSRVIGQLNRYHLIYVVSFDRQSGFATVRYNGQTGYVAAQYLRLSGGNGGNVP